LAARLRGEKTNNRAELMAVISAFDIADKIDPGKTTPLMVYTDSELVINSVMKWMSGWKRHGWRKSDGKTIMNKDLIMMLDERKALRPVSMKHVRAHTGRSDWESMWNDAADKLARKAAES
jgi:ribonuclease HI